jgi:hypothetical protein
VRALDVAAFAQPPLASTTVLHLLQTVTDRLAEFTPLEGPPAREALRRLSARCKFLGGGECASVRDEAVAPDATRWWYDIDAGKCQAIRKALADRRRDHVASHDDTIAAT